MNYRFYRTADKRLDEIWDYTLREWGEAQAENYVRGLFAQLDKIVTQRILWKPIQQKGFEASIIPVTAITTFSSGS